ncbi:MAG: hypothetical protein SVR94_06685, partial [Pseudomonadota bacterium]|nr:hypothetical protein [Pseudomonadota bacterium]
HTVTLPINPGEQVIEVDVQQPVGLQRYFTTPELTLGLDSVNTRIELNMPSNRWILFTGGLPVGPAVMIWGILVVILMVAIGLGRLSFIPVKTYEWLLLLLVLTQIPWPLMFIVIAWFLALAGRARLPTTTPAWQFNLIQFGLSVLTFIALVALMTAIYQGLLGGYPNMYIMGNDSSGSQLRWFTDHSSTTLPQVWVYSLPMWSYRLTMLFWALWLSWAVLRWAQWGWRCFSTQGLWQPLFFKSLASKFKFNKE